MSHIQLLRIKYLDRNTDIERTLPDIDPRDPIQVIDLYRTIQHKKGRGEISRDEANILTVMLMNRYGLNPEAYHKGPQSIGDIIDDMENSGETA